ncbi:MAG: ATP-binding cassette domain-containing protein [Anaerolineaceae bacterium]|nr:ATP-binding cassette domain-containing protein [Anaerolineaceae bacterium]
MTAAPHYDLQHIQHTYGSRDVLRIPALRVEPGEILGIVGPSGAGKSTLLRLLALLEQPTQGTATLHLDNQAVTAESATMGQRRQVVMVFQRPALLRRSVRANIAYGLRVRGERDHREPINAVLKQVALDHLATADAHTLSGGEAQRVALARALVLQPRVLLLDEPTANLDPYNVRLIESLVQQHHAGGSSTVILVTHNIFQAQRLATRVALLLDGELVEAAPASDFFQSPTDSRTAAFISGDLVY